MPELIIILVIILIIFGAGKLPQIGEGIGKGIKNFKKATKDKDEIDVTPQKTEEISEKKWTRLPLLKDTTFIRDSLNKLHFIHFLKDAVLKGEGERSNAFTF